jgi:hypothetical protein
MTLRAAAKKAQRRLLRRRRALADGCMKHFLRDIEMLRDIAKAAGYALTVHGTLCRDIDLVACPWTARALAASTLHKRLFGYLKVGNVRAYTNKKPELKPHGRRAWSINVADGGVYYDLSVMPRI